MKIMQNLNEAPDEVRLSSSHTSEPAYEKWSIASWVVLVIALMITAVATRQMASSVTRNAEHDFLSRSDDICTALRDRLNDYARILRGGVAVFNVSDEVTREKWCLFKQTYKAETQLLGIQGIGFSLLIPRTELAQHIQKIRSEGFPDYTVRPSGDRENYSSIIYLEPFSGRNLLAFGFDMLSEPVRRKAMERARDTDLAALSGKVILVQETGEDVQAGTLMYVPVYRKGMPTTSVDQRCAAIYGWVYSPYRMKDMINGMLSAHNLKKAQQLHLEIYDGEQPSGDALLYGSHPAANESLLPDMCFTSQVPIDFNGCHWTLRFAQSSGGFFTAKYTLAWLTLGGGTLIAVLLFMLIRILLSTRDKAQRIAKKLTVDLRESETKFRLLAENIQDVFWLSTPTIDRIIYVSPAFEKIWGLPCESLYQKPQLFIETIHPEDQKRVIATLQEHAKGIWNVEYRIIRPDGSTRWILDRGFPVYNDSGTLIAMCGIAIDMTDRKRAEDAILLKTVLLEAQSEACIDGILAVDTEGHTISCNKRFGEVWNIPQNILDTQDDKVMQEYVSKQLKNPTEFGHRIAYLYEHKNEKSSDEIEFIDGHFFERYSAPLISVENKYHGRIWFFRDLTERKQAEDAVRKSEEKYRVLVETTDTGFLILNNDGKVIDANAEYVRLAGHRELADIRGKAVSEWTADYDRQRNAEAVDQCVKVGFIKNFGIDYVDGNGRITPVEVNASISGTGESMRIVSLCRDITERRQAEMELQKLDKLQSIGMLAGGIAHDFNNILQGLYGNISFAKEDLAKGHPRYLSLEEAEKSMTRAVRLTKQLLTFANGGNPVKESVSLGTMVEEIARFNLSGSNVNLVFHSAEDLWLVDADRGQIEQVISNLVINARQAMPKGGCLTITLENADLSAEPVSGLKQRRYIRVIFRDEGCGIDPKMISKIFDPFFTTKQIGSGLGLAIVWSIINKHGGHIDVASELGKGTTFTFCLPASASLLPEETQTPAEECPAKARLAKILALEDEDLVSKILVRMLTPCGYTVVTAPDGQEAVTLYRQAMEVGAPFDAVILDLTIPGGPGGEEVIKDLLALDPNVRAIVSSGYANNPVMSDPAAYGFKGTISKPYTVNALRKIVARVLV